MLFNKVRKYEKENMNKIRRIVNYYIAPIYAIIMALIIITVLITMSIDEKKYTPLAIILFSFFGLLTISLFIATPFIRRKEIQIEMSKYNFDSFDISNKNTYELKAIAGIEDKGYPVIFNSDGLILYNVLYKYEDFEISLVTSNHLNQIHLLIQFVLKERIEDHTPYLIFKLDQNLLAIINKFNLITTNKNIFDYALLYKEDAFNQIYKYGYVKKIKH